MQSGASRAKHAPAAGSEASSAAHLSNEDKFEAFTKNVHRERLPGRPCTSFGMAVAGSALMAPSCVSAAVTERQGSPGPRQSVGGPGHPHHQARRPSDAAAVGHLQGAADWESRDEVLCDAAAAHPDGGHKLETVPASALGCKLGALAQSLVSPGRLPLGASGLAVLEDVDRLGKRSSSLLCFAVLTVA